MKRIPVILTGPQSTQVQRVLISMRTCWQPEELPYLEMEPTPNRLWLSTNDAVNLDLLRRLDAMVLTAAANAANAIRTRKPALVNQSQDGAGI